MTTLPLSVRRPKLVLLAWAAVVGVMGFFISGYPKMSINPTAKSFIRADDPDLAFDANAKKMLGDDELIVVVIESPTSVFDIPTLTYIDRLTSDIEKLPVVRKVYSLTRADNIRSAGGVLVADDLITDLPKTPEDLARIEKEAFENPTYINMIVAPDKKVASINIELKAGHTTAEDTDTVEKIYDIIDKAAGTKPAAVKTHFSGFPVASYVGARYMLEDMMVFSGGALVLLTIIMFLVLRSWQGVLFTHFVSIASVQVVFGLLTACGFKVTMPLSSMMAFMTAIGMEYSVYVAFAYMNEVQGGAPGRDKREAIADAIKDVRFTVIMSAACTTAAFLSICTNPLHDLKLMGAFLGIGTMTCCTAALTIIPAWITKFGLPVPAREQARHRWLQRVVDRIGELDTKKPFVVLGGLAVLCGLGVFSVTKLHTDIDAFQYFRKSSTIRQDHEFIRTRMAGDALLPVVISMKDVDTFKDPANLRKLDEIAQYAATLPHVSKVLSHADHIKLMNQALRGGAKEDFKLPDTKAAVEQFLLLHNEPDDFHAWIDHDYKLANVMLRMDTMSSTVLYETETKVEAFAKQKFPDGDTRVVGTTILVARAIDTMAMSLVSGLISAALLIWLIMIIGFRSVKIGTLALIPTLPPALCVYATLPLIGHALDPPTSITGVIALGIAIDDTTWFLATWVSRRRRSIDGASAVSQTLSTIGRPMVLSSAVLGSGFLVMLFSRYGTLFWLGVMMAIVAFWSIFWDVLCTPTIVRLFDPMLPRGSFGHESKPPR